MRAHRMIQGKLYKLINRCSDNRMALAEANYHCNLGTVLLLPTRHRNLTQFAVYLRLYEWDNEKVK